MNACGTGYVRALFRRGDPYFNPNLSHRRGSVQLRSPLTGFHPSRGRTPPMGDPQNPMTVFFVISFLSGFCSLVYQVVWLQAAMADFGVTTPLHLDCPLRIHGRSAPWEVGAEGGWCAAWKTGRRRSLSGSMESRNSPLASRGWW